MVASSLPMDATLAVAGGKGGCGKTTATLGLAHALVQRGRQPLVVDADHDVPDLHVRAGVAREPGLPAIVEGTDPARVSQASERFPGVAVVAAGTIRVDPAGAMRILAALPRPVLFDCPAGAGPDVAAPLRVADGSVIASTDTRTSRADAAKTVEMARSLGAAPVLALERSTGMGSAQEAGESAMDVPTVRVPDGGRRPLQGQSVRKAFARAVRHLYDEPAGTPAETHGWRRDSHTCGFGRKR